MTFKERLGDRRAELRFEIIGQLWGSLESVEYLPLRDIGLGGALVESRVALPTDSVHGVRLLLAGEPDEVTIRVRHARSVRTADAERYLVGVEFLDLGPASQARIDRFVAGSLEQATPAAEA